MAKSTINKPNNPQKNVMKIVCKFLHVLALGDCWYEKSTLSPIIKRLYPIWVAITHFYYISVIIFEILAFKRTDLTVDEVNDNVQYLIAHSTVYLKFMCVIAQKQKIKVLFRKLFEDTRALYTRGEDEREAIRRAKWFCIYLAYTIVVCLFTATMNGVRLHYATGVPVRTLVTYWPTRTDFGFLALIARILIQFYWWYLITTMVVIDVTCLCSLIFLSYRFRVICKYFNSIEEELNIEIENKSVDETEKRFMDQFLKGILLHRETLICARCLQDSLGPIYSVQIVQSIGLFAICLIKFVKVEAYSVAFLVANFSFIQAMISLSVTYMAAAGDITYEAALIPTSIFHCGWERIRCQKKLRPLLLVTLQSSQRPIFMTAFGIFNLSYSTLISIGRASYSFFAVMY